MSAGQAAVGFLRKGIQFFFNDTATTEIYTLSLHDALPICEGPAGKACGTFRRSLAQTAERDRKSTRLNSSHLVISYAVFCLKKTAVRVREHRSRGHSAGQRAATCVARRAEIGMLVAGGVRLRCWCGDCSLQKLFFLEAGHEQC